MSALLSPVVRNEIVFTASRSSGPGGQNVNKVNSKMTLRWNIAESAISPEVKSRLLARLTTRVTVNDEIVIQSDEFRDQARNKEACLDKLAVMIQAALRIKKKRRATKPKRSSKEERLKGKKARGRTKALRGKNISE